MHWNGTAFALSVRQLENVSSLPFFTEQILPHLSPLFSHRSCCLKDSRGYWLWGSLITGSCCLWGFFPSLQITEDFRDACLFMWDLSVVIILEIISKFRLEERPWLTQHLSHPKLCRVQTRYPELSGTSKDMLDGVTLLKGYVLYKRHGVSIFFLFKLSEWPLWVSTW